MNILTKDDHVVVIGAGLAGWRFVEALRREGYEGTITLIGEEVHAPYDRPPLSKQILTGKWEVDKATLATDEHLENANADVRLGVPAVGVNIAGRSVELANGDTVKGTHLVIATGTRARELSFPSSGLLPSLRNRDDVQELHVLLTGLPEGSSVGIIGGGFIGAEAATSLKARGFVPIVLEVAERPLVGALGDAASRWLASLAHDADIELRNNQRITDVALDGSVTISFANGESLEVGAVIAAAGSQLDLTWLETSGLRLDNGIVVDRNLQAAPNVAAIGDVARFSWLGTTGESLVRIEHWQVATDHAAHLAHYWVTGESFEQLIPYFWSDQYGKKIQMLGHPDPTDDVQLVSGTVDEKKWLALYSRSGIVTGLLALSAPRWLMLAKPLLEGPTSVDDALQHAIWTN